MPSSWLISDPTTWTLPEPLPQSISEPTPWSILDLATWSLPEPVTWPIPEPTISAPQQPTLWSILDSSSLSLPGSTTWTTADPASWSIPDPLTMGAGQFTSQTQTALTQQQALGEPGAFVCEVDGCGRSSHLLQDLNAHLRESHKDQLFCPQPGCTDRRIWPDVVDLYVHAKRVHLNDDRYWCHICYHSGDAPGGIKLHVNVNHWHHDAAFEICRIQAEWHRRRFPV